jgi:hypothetical protein
VQQDNDSNSGGSTDIIERMREWDDEEAQIKAQQRERELLDRSNTYMRSAHLMPPRDEFSDVHSYVRLLKQCERAPATEVIFYRFNPTLAQRRANASVLKEWLAAQNKRGRGNRHSRAMGLVHNWCFVARSRGRVPLASVPCGERDDTTIRVIRYLAPLVNDGSITRDQLVDAIIEASIRNGHIPGNKNQWFVERQIDDAIAKFTEPFDWDRLDGNV